MQEFRHDKIRVECETTNRRDGFNHRARLFYDGVYIRKDICQYYNRTWERFTYSSVLDKLIDRSVIIPPAEKLLFLKKYYM